MSEALAHVYDLALRALAEQERQVAELRGRLTPVLASGGLGATLLTPLAFRGRHPVGIVEVAVAVGLDERRISNLFDDQAAPRRVHTDDVRDAA